MTWFVTSLRENPELAIFLTLAVGFVIGRVRIGSFRLGNVVGTLLAGVLVGQLDVKVDPLVKTVFFALFLFATGYKVGPQFFRGLKKNAVPQALVTLVLWGSIGSAASVQAYDQAEKPVDRASRDKVPERTGPEQPIPSFDLTVSAPVRAV